MGTGCLLGLTMNPPKQDLSKILEGQPNPTELRVVWSVYNPTQSFFLFFIYFILWIFDNLIYNSGWV